LGNDPVRCEVRRDGDGVTIGFPDAVAIGPNRSLRVSAGG
jgi:hypothetical protein